MTILAPENLPGDAASDFVAVSLVPLAGSRQRVGAGSAEGHILAYREWLPHPDETVAVRLDDDAMFPILPAGSVVAVDRSLTDPERLQGKMVAAAPDGVPIIRWLDLSGRHLIFRPNQPSRDHPLIPIELRSHRPEPDPRPGRLVLELLQRLRRTEAGAAPRSRRTPGPCPPPARRPPDSTPCSATREPVFLIGPDRRILVVNRAWEELTGHPADEVTGPRMPPPRPDPAGRPRRARGELLPRPRKPWPAPAAGSTTLIIRPDGERLVRRLEFWPFHDAKGALVVLVGLVRPAEGPALARESEAHRLRAELLEIRDRLQARHGFDALIGRGPAHRRLLDQVVAAAGSDVPA